MTRRLRLVTCTPHSCRQFLVAPRGQGRAERTATRHVELAAGTAAVAVLRVRGLEVRVDGRNLLDAIGTIRHQVQQQYQ